MNHLTADTARVFQLHGVTFNSFAAGLAGAQALAAWRADFAPETPGQAHVMTSEEVLYVISGSLDIEVDDESFTAAMGDAVLVPSGSVFRISNSTQHPASAWATSLIGMRVSMQAGEGDQIAPPWAQ